MTDMTIMQRIRTMHKRVDVEDGQLLISIGLVIGAAIGFFTSILGRL